VAQKVVKMMQEVENAQVAAMRPAHSLCFEWLLAQN
jgi:hypothetical protein